MSEFPSDLSEQIFERCQANLPALTEVFNRCFQTDWTFRLDEIQEFDAALAETAMNGPGSLLVIEVADDGLLCLIPEQVLSKLPPGARSSQSTALDRLCHDWTPLIVPEGGTVGVSTCFDTDNLGQEVLQAKPREMAHFLLMECLSQSNPPEEDSTEEKPLSGESDPKNDASDSNESDITRSDPAGLRIFLVWPVQNPPLPLTDDRDENSGHMFGALPEALEQDVPANRIERIRTLPVEVIVRLAEKKIEVGQLVDLSPGVLLTFDKSCEDLLDLYVNNRMYGRGEAVKIGERFGLKINQLGGHKPQEKRLLPRAFQNS